jgi:chromosome partitioning protein
MAEIICVIGNKGGTGKTTLSHMLCQGLGLLGHRSACVLTDTSREPLNPGGRRYITADARTSESLTKVVDKLRTLDNWIGVIDGGGNRTEMDRKLYALSDIVLLPFRDSHEDIRTVIRDLDMFPRAYAVPSQWPSNAWQREAADRSVYEMMRPYRHRILNPVNALSASKLMLHRNVPDQLPTPLANACRAIARQVLEVLEIEQADDGSCDAAGVGVATRLSADEMPIRAALVSRTTS